MAATEQDLRLLSMGAEQTNLTGHHMRFVIKHSSSSSSLTFIYPLSPTSFICPPSPAPFIHPHSPASVIHPPSLASFIHLPTPESFIHQSTPASFIYPLSPTFFIYPPSPASIIHPHPPASFIHPPSPASFILWLHMQPHDRDSCFPSLTPFRLLYSLSSSSPSTASLQSLSALPHPPPSLSPSHISSSTVQDLQQHQQPDPKQTLSFTKDSSFHLSLGRHEVVFFLYN